MLFNYAKGSLVHIRKMIISACNSDVPVIIDPKGTNFSRYQGDNVSDFSFVRIEGSSRVI
ncbi:hypothetical protein [Candidatus Gullanella endobia]|uniref:hypothetical protein n=1 Tax=Candidatus Gullanella endobia TaxID=1070130 RepID=UPI00082BBB7D|nr:hypothetical protein [Candidatus Gullanella endobia]